ncbi:uncharacterized protein A4U43_C03F19700 [Asparagus officinalis]|uniref:Uncharacterized protein n=1 Tax=Asparagus officinalis TaxID=4686 RepID=A0A5P1FBF5_ASPOF|nr:uncharacterized protein A4U43_C03F19700 [Asparagus officinalis]
MAGSMEMTAGMEPTEKARSWVDLWVRASRARVRCGWPRLLRRRRLQSPLPVPILVSQRQAHGREQQQRPRGHRP